MKGNLHGRFPRLAVFAVVVAALALSAATLAGASAPTRQSFSVVSLGNDHWETTIAMALNDSGQVVGWGNTAATGTQHAFSWTRSGGIVDLGSLGGDYSQAFAVSNSGAVVGASSTADGSGHAFLWTQQSGMVDVGVGVALAVNDRGQVVGYSVTTDGQVHAFSWTRTGGMIDLGPGQALGVNDRGQVVGTTGTTFSEGFSWTAAKGMVDLGPAVAWAVSKNGDVVGGADFNGAGHAFLRSQEGGLLDLGALGSDSSNAWSVNGNGSQVVGDSSPTSDSSQPHRVLLDARDRPG